MDKMVEGVKFKRLRILLLLFVLLLTSLNSKLQLMLGCFAAKCEAAGMKISTSKSEAMVLSWKRFTEELLSQVEERTRP